MNRFLSSVGALLLLAMSLAAFGCADECEDEGATKCDDELLMVCDTGQYVWDSGQWKIARDCGDSEYVCCTDKSTMIGDYYVAKCRPSCEE